MSPRPPRHQHRIKQARILLQKHLWEIMGKETGETGRAIRSWSTDDPVSRREEGKLGGSGLDSLMSKERSARLSVNLWTKIGQRRGLLTPRCGLASVPAALSHQRGARCGKSGLSTNTVIRSEHSSRGVCSVKFPVVGGLQGTFSGPPHPRPTRPK